MAQIAIEINGRRYTVGCADGEEDRLRGLANYVDAKVRDLAHKTGAAGEARLLLLACLTLADELGEAYQDAEAARSTDQNGEALRERVTAIEGQMAAREDALARHLDQLAQRMAKMADRFEAR